LLLNCQEIKRKKANCHELINILGWIRKKTNSIAEHDTIQIQQFSGGSGEGNVRQRSTPASVNLTYIYLKIYLYIVHIILNNMISINNIHLIIKQKCLGSTSLLVDESLHYWTNKFIVNGSRIRAPMGHHRIKSNYYATMLYINIRHFV